MRHIGVLVGLIVAGTLTVWWEPAALVEWCAVAAVLSFIGVGLGYSFDNLRAMIPHRGAVRKVSVAGELPDEEDSHLQPHSSVTSSFEIIRDEKPHFGRLFLHTTMSRGLMNDTE